MTGATALHTVPRLATDRLLLREWQEPDREPFARLNADPRVVEYFPSVLDRASSDALVDRIVAHWAEDGHGLWAVEVVGSRRFVGFVGLAAPSWEASFTPCFVFSAGGIDI